MKRILTIILPILLLACLGLAGVAGAQEPAPAAFAPDPVYGVAPLVAVAAVADVAPVAAVAPDAFQTFVEVGPGKDAGVALVELAGGRAMVLYDLYAQGPNLGLVYNYGRWLRPHEVGTFALSQLMVYDEATGTNSPLPPGTYKLAVAGPAGVTVTLRSDEAWVGVVAR